MNEEQMVIDPACLRHMEIKYSTINDEKRVILQRTGNTQDAYRFELNESEWLCFSELFVFLNQLMFWYKKTLNAMKTYYSHYLKICCENNRVYLGPFEFFSPNDVTTTQLYTPAIQPPQQQQTFNFFRLFHEIGFLCRENIMQEVLKKIYSTV